MAKTKAASNDSDLLVQFVSWAIKGSLKLTAKGLVSLGRLLPDKITDKVPSFITKIVDMGAYPKAANLRKELLSVTREHSNERIFTPREMDKLTKTNGYHVLFRTRRGQKLVSEMVNYNNADLIDVLANKIRSRKELAILDKILDQLPAKDLAEATRKLIESPDLKTILTKENLAQFRDAVKLHGKENSLSLLDNLIMPAPAPVAKNTPPISAPPPRATAAAAPTKPNAPAPTSAKPATTASAQQQPVATAANAPAWKRIIVEGPTSGRGEGGGWVNVTTPKRANAPYEVLIGSDEEALLAKLRGRGESKGLFTDHVKPAATSLEQVMRTIEKRRDNGTIGHS